MKEHADAHSSWCLDDNDDHDNNNCNNNNNITLLTNI